MKPDLTIYKEKLESEKERLTSELNAIGTTDQDQTGDWHAGVADLGESDFADEIADRLEEFQEREATEVNLEKRLRDVNLALEKIEVGTYGICEVSGEPIEQDRLQANPAARTCKMHLNEEDALV